MAKLDLGVTAIPGYGRSISKQLDRHIIKCIIVQRKEAIERTKNFEVSKIGSKKDSHL
jgi:hypothetical protein